jgi:hypothetical protein
LYSVSARASGNGLQHSSLSETPGWPQQQLVAMKQLNAARLARRKRLAGRKRINTIEIILVTKHNFLLVCNVSSNS